MTVGLGHSCLSSLISRVARADFSADFASNMVLPMSWSLCWAVLVLSACHRPLKNLQCTEHLPRLNARRRIGCGAVGMRPPAPPSSSLACRLQVLPHPLTSFVLLFGLLFPMQFLHCSQRHVVDVLRHFHSYRLYHNHVFTFSFDFLRTSNNFDCELFFQPVVSPQHDRDTLHGLPLCRWKSVKPSWLSWQSRAPMLPIDQIISPQHQEAFKHIDMCRSLVQWWSRAFFVCKHFIVLRVRPSGRTEKHELTLKSDTHHCRNQEQVRRLTGGVRP